MWTDTEIDRARGTLLGLAVGDALGGPLESLSPLEIEARHGSVRDMIGGGWLGLAPGQGTDDTAMALALARSLATSVGFDAGRVLAAYLEWFETNPSDVGKTVRAALTAARESGSVSAVEEVHHATGTSASNDSLMRIAPVALRYLRQPGVRGLSARADSKLTHHDERAGDACAWLCEALAVLIVGAEPAELSAPAALEHAWSSPEAAALMAGGDAAGDAGTALAVASVAVRTSASFEEGLIWAVNLGGDADTNGAVAGALLGARFGAQAIPERWLEPLAARDQASALADRLIDLADRQVSEASGRSPGSRAGAVSDPAAMLKAALEPFAGRLAHDPESRVAAEAAIAASGAFRAGGLLVSNVPSRDVLYVLERGYCEDGLEPQRQIEICQHVSLILDLDGRECVGFSFGDLSGFDFEAPANHMVWTGPRFDVPALGIEQGTVGLIAATARLVLADLRTPDRVLFDAAVHTPDPTEALELWDACLAEGNELARYALGYTLLKLGRAREAHEQLRRYSALVRENAWAWCYLGQASEDLDDLEGAEYAYRQALEATAAGSFETDAAPRLAALLARIAQKHRG